MMGLYVINSLEGGGAERVFSQLITLLNDDESLNHSIEVVLLDNKEEKYLLSDKVKVHRIDCGSDKLLLLWRYIGILRRVKPEYVVSFLTRSNTLNVIGSVIYGYKAIISERGNTNGRMGTGVLGLIKRWIVKYIYKKASCTIAVSGGVKDCLETYYDISSEKIVVLNNPIDVFKINKEPADNIDHIGKPIIAMGRLVPSKGFDTLIRAYARSGLVCGVQILGQGPELNNLQDLADELDIRDHIQFLGFQENPHEYIKHALFFVSTSKLEGFPNALLEAMAMGKTVIATDCDYGPREILGLNEKIVEGEYKYTTYGMMTQIDDIKALSSAMTRLVSDLDTRRLFEKLSLKRVKDFNVVSFYKQYTDILNKALG